ncbi:MAG TPA: PD-(D/E)XK nuclease family protein [Pyrinomonadaceae bacterium]|nr:PD-(D/E)XK nuclease family protein [Pyrinomonadaceae bacterium]
MANEIWLGPLLGNNRSRLIARCAKLVSAGKPESFLYLAASHPLLEVVTQGVLDGVSNRGVWGELPIYLFRGFVRRLLQTAVDQNGQLLPPRVPIDQDELPLKRSLVSQILARLMATGQLKAIAPLANREGCVNSIATLLGEIERSAKTPAEVAEIIATRTSDLALSETTQRGDPERGLHTQTDFDQEVTLIYATYTDLLNRHQLTEADADQLRALGVLGGGESAAGFSAAGVPWLGNVQLLVLDGFFDFTPVQGEILRQLIPQIPEVLVNLDHDERNPEIFLPFQQTIAQLSAVAPFAIKQASEEVAPARGALSELRQKLFNPTLANSDEGEVEQSEIKYFECGDRDTEIRAAAKEIKRLVLREGYALADIALVVRQRASYAETIARVMREESLPCNLEAQVDANDIPANRAALKLFAILEQNSREEAGAPRVSALADLIKSEYFRLNEKDLRALSAQFDSEYAGLLREKDPQKHPTPNAELEARLKKRYRIGLWDADALENAFAYVGSQLRVSDWVARAGKLIKELPGAAATRELLNIDSIEQARDPDEADQIENAETAKVESTDVERKRRPSRDIHPAALAWTSLVIQAFAEKIQAVEREGTPARLRLALMKLLEDFSFRKQITRPIRSTIADEELPRAMLNYNSLEALRRAFVAAIKSIEIASALSEPPASAGKSEPPASVGGRDSFLVTSEKTGRRPAHADGSDLPAHAGGAHTSLATFIEEVRRGLGSQSQVYGAADRGGLRILEATDVRGLRFRVVFIAGLVEGGFPLRASRDWIYPHEERERLKRYGLTLEDISPATLLKEEHYFYQAACRATERLYLSRPLVLADDSETVASYYIDELRRAVSPFRVETETVRRDYEGKALAQVTTASELNVTLVRQQERHVHRGDKHDLLPQPRIKRLLTLARNDSFLSDSALRRIEIERERASPRFGPYDGEITDPDLVALLNRRFGADFVHSASGLSIYGNCGYRFFGQRVLKLEPRGEAALDLQAIDAGKLLHDILRRFFEQHRRERLTELDREELRTELMELADRVFDEHERVVPPLNQQIWKIDREIRKILLDQVLLYELDIQEQTAAAGVVPAYFEVAFGGMRSPARDPDSTDQPLELTRSTFVGEETIKISGQIDRVDVAQDNTLIAYDYKLSTGSTKDDIKSGRSLQLPIYLEALERLLLPNQPIAGGGYYVIRGGNERRNKGLHRAGALEYSKIRANVNGVLSDDEWRQLRRDVILKIWDFLDHIRAGQFDVNPSEKDKTCRFCDFAAVCRYDRYRIDGKRLSADYAD